MPLGWKQKKIEEKMRFYCEPREERRMKDKLHIANNFMNRLNIRGSQREEVLTIIRNFNLDDLLKNKSLEIVIACVCFHCIKLYNSRARLENYRLFNELGLSDNVMISFYNNLYRLEHEKVRPTTSIKECY